MLLLLVNAPFLAAANLLILLLIFLIIIGAGYWLITHLAPAQFKDWLLGIMLVIVVIVLIRFLLAGGANTTFF